ncbi:coiled-coil domain-containing protein 22 -like protein, partial [Asbolus verrucosus]
MAISTCLETIIPDMTFPKKLPPSMSSKLKITSSLAEQIKELGFREDMGYQTILYCNEAEIRRVLMFLIERLPRETTLKQYWIHNVPAVTKQCDQKELVQSLLFEDCFMNSGDKHLRNCFKIFASKVEELPAQVLLSDPEIAHSSILAETVTVAKVAEAKTENKLESLLEDLKRWKAKYSALQETKKNYEIKLSQVNKMKDEEEAILKETLSKVNLKSKTLTREISALTGQVDRSFTLSDELIF